MSWYKIMKGYKVPKFCKRCGHQLSFRSLKCGQFGQYNEDTGEEIVEEQYGCTNDQCSSNSRDCT